MTSKSLDQYFDQRYQDQLKWYSNKTAHNKKWYRRYQIAIAALSGTVTVTVALGMQDQATSGWHIVSLVASAMVAALAGLQKAFRFHENWVEYRTTAEQLKKEGYYYEFRCGDYSAAESADRLFVERVESLISRQNTLWTARTLRPEENGSPSGQNDPAQGSAAP